MRKNNHWLNVKLIIVHCETLTLCKRNTVLYYAYNVPLSTRTTSSFRRTELHEVRDYRPTEFVTWWSDEFYEEVQTLQDIPLELRILMYLKERRSVRGEGELWNVIAKYLNQAIDRVPRGSKRFMVHGIFVATSRYLGPRLQWAHVRRIQPRGRRPLFSPWTQSCCISYSVASTHTEPKLDPAAARARVQSGSEWSGTECTHVVFVKGLK